MALHIPSLLVVLILTSGLLWLFVCAANKQPEDGMRYWACALALQFGSYLLLMQANQVGDFAAFVGATLLRSGCWVAFTLGLYQFYGLQPRRWLIGSPVPVIAVTFVALQAHLEARVAVTNLIFAGQCSFILLVLWQQRQITAGRGKYFLAFGLTLAITLLVMRAGAAASGLSSPLIELSETSDIQSISLLGALSVMLLLAFGFVIMSKDRSDDLTHVLTIRDELTGLSNRRHLNEVLAIEWERAGRSDQPLSVAMIDIDHFKLYNDHYGHLAGDACLRQVAQKIQSNARRTGDLAARYGGEEFLLIFPDADASVALQLAQRVCQSIEAMGIPHELTASQKITISIGVATTSAGLYRDTESLLRAADQALYLAKAGGRNHAQAVPPPKQAQSLAGASHPRLVQLIWRRSYECGHAAIDADHQAMFGQVNHLLTTALAGRPGTEVAALIDELLLSMGAHFEEEEALFTAAGYPGADAHMVLHRGLIDTARELTRQFRAAEVPIGELFEFLAHDLVARHILIADRQFYPSLPPETVPQAAGIGCPTPPP